MSNTVQCQNPVLVGASGSKSVTTKLFVSAGAPDHDNCGEVLPPPQPLNSVEMGSEPPAVNVVLVTAIGAGLDGLAGAAKGRADDAGVAVAAGAGCVVSCGWRGGAVSGGGCRSRGRAGRGAKCGAECGSYCRQAHDAIAEKPRAHCRLLPESVRYMRGPADRRLRWSNDRTITALLTTPLPRAGPVRAAMRQRNAEPCTQRMRRSSASPCCGAARRPACLRLRSSGLVRCGARLGGVRVRSRSRRTKSASLPAPAVPFPCS